MKEKHTDKVVTDLNHAMRRLGLRSASILTEFSRKGRGLGSMLWLYEKLIRPECAAYAFIKRQMLRGRVSSLLAIVAVAAAVLAMFMHLGGVKAVTLMTTFAVTVCVVMYRESQMMESEKKKERVRVMLAKQITEVSGALTKIHAYQITTDAGEPVREFVRNNLRRYALEMLVLEGVIAYPSVSSDTRSWAAQEKACYRERLGLFMEGCVTLGLADGDIGPCFKEAKRELRARQSKVAEV